MAVETKVPYRVTEKALKKWLEQNLGDEKNEAGEKNWTYESVHKDGNDWWQVTATRQITPDEIEEMKIQDEKLKKLGPQYTFEADEDDEDD